MTGEHRCPNCGGLLGEAVPGQLCLGCLLSFGLKNPNEPPAELDHSLPPELSPASSELVAGKYRLLEQIGEGGCGTVIGRSNSNTCVARSR